MATTVALGLTLALMVVPGFVAGANAAPTAAAPSDEPPPRACTATYHDDLQTLAQREVPKLKSELDAILAPRAEINRRWYFWDTKSKRRSRRRGPDGRVRPMRLRGRVCVNETYTSRGRLRCRKWAKATPQLVARLSRWIPRRDPYPARRVRRELRFLNDTVINRGAISAFQSGGRFYWLVRRLVIDLENYLTQPPSAGICTGVPTLISFYMEQLEPFDERIAFVKKLEARAQRRLETSLKALGRLRNAAAKAAARESTEDDSDNPARLASLERPPTPDPARLNTEEAVVQAFVHDLSPLVNATSAPANASITTFADARLALDVERLVAPSKKRHDATVKGLRAAEARQIARQTLSIYTQFRAAITDALDAIRARHSANCTCSRRP
ncbi:MAG: hypothetical protein AAFV26_10985 [Pseudomonadota bacterium]